MRLLHTLWSYITSLTLCTYAHKTPLCVVCKKTGRIIRVSQALCKITGFSRLYFKNKNFESCFAGSLPLQEELLKQHIFLHNARGGTTVVRITHTLMMEGHVVFFFHKFYVADILDRFPFGVGMFSNRPQKLIYGSFVQSYKKDYDVLCTLLAKQPFGSFPSVEHDGLFVLGWKSNNAHWLCFLPFDILPHMGNPQEQRLQTLGRLTSSIVHDFNNLLTATIAFCDSFFEDHDEEKDSKLFHNIMHIKQNTLRGARFVQRLLKFASTQEESSSSVLDLQEVLVHFGDALRRLMGKAINLTVHAYRHPLYVRCETVDLEQIVMNLCINARDAIKGSGEITIRTFPMENATEKSCALQSLSPGSYVGLCVKDNGEGIVSADKIFDPFFSTKKAKGTGLGLTAVAHIVKKLHGSIDVESKRGVGTQFIVYLPAQKKEAMHSGHHTSSEQAAHKHILLIEDEDDVCFFVKRVLKHVGYRVTALNNAKEALEKMLDKTLVPDLIISDIMMPYMTGVEMVEALVQQGHYHKVLLMSGYMAKEVVSNVGDYDHVSFLQKPFTKESMLKKVDAAFRGKSSCMTMNES